VATWRGGYSRALESADDSVRSLTVAYGRGARARAGLAATTEIPDAIGVLPSHVDVWTSPFDGRNGTRLATARLFPGLTIARVCGFETGTRDHARGASRNAQQGLRSEERSPRCPFRHTSMVPSPFETIDVTNRVPGRVVEATSLRGAIRKSRCFDERKSRSVEPRRSTEEHGSSPCMSARTRAAIPLRRARARGNPSGFPGSPRECVGGEWYR
jgi:hypothetical protein